MTGPRTVRDALIAELLGDVGKLHESVQALKASLPALAEETAARLCAESAALVSAAETLRHEAQALLADDSRQALSEAREAIEHINASTRQAQHQAVQAVEHTVSQLRRAAERLDESAQAARWASVGLTWKVALIAILCGVGSAGLTSGLGHWLPRGSAQAEQQQALGAALERRWRAMTPKEQAQLRKLMQGSEP